MRKEPLLLERNLWLIASTGALALALAFEMMGTSTYGSKFALVAYIAVVAVILRLTWLLRSRMFVIESRTLLTLNLTGLLLCLISNPYVNFLPSMTFPPLVLPAISFLNIGFGLSALHETRHYKMLRASETSDPSHDSLDHETE